LEKAPGFIHTTIERFFTKNKIGINNPNIWIMAMYMDLRIGVFQRLLTVDFFKNGFKIIRQTALKGDSEHEVSKDFHRYWLFSLMFIGPFKCAETLLDICGKKLPQHYPWEIQEYINYHLEVFFADRSQKRDLFLRALNRFRTTNEAEAFHKFLLLDTFFEELGFNDLFLNHTYRELSGQFRSRMYQFRNTLSSIGFPIKKGYFKSVMQTVFDAVEKGKSFMFTGLSDIILSFPRITIEERDIKELKKSSLAELFLLAVFYDKPGKGREKEKELKDLITTMVDSEVIDVSNFLRLLLSRLDGANLENMVQDVDNGISRFLNGLVTYIHCALPYLEKEDLLIIKKTIVSCLTHVKIVKIRKAMIQFIDYIYHQLPGEDFTNILKKIFSLAATAHYTPFGLKFLKLSQDELGNEEIIKYSQKRLLMDRSLEEQGTPFDRDFVAFMLNHGREELFPGEDKRLKEALKTYFDIKTEELKHFSLQWLMDLQQFIEKGFIQLDTEMETRVREFIDTAFEIPGVIREWKLKIFSGKMIKVFNQFARFFKDHIVSKIIKAYRIDINGKEVELYELDPEVQDNFAHLLKVIYQLEHHNNLNDTILRNIKEFIEEGLTGGGYLGAFWEKLDKKEKSQLTCIMLDLWLPESEESILRAVKATGEFLKYKTDEEAMKELTNRLLYCIFSGSTLVKIQWCNVVSAHVNHVNHVIEKSLWFTENEKKILDCLNLFKKEKNLELLREFLKLAQLFTIEEVKEIIDYLKENAPYAEIKRTAGRFAPLNSK
jgi:hypothetical protein